MALVPRARWTVQRIWAALSGDNKVAARPERGGMRHSLVALKQVKLLSTKEGFPVTALREINVLLRAAILSRFRGVMRLVSGGVRG